ncbi:MAG: exosome complex RNA-binding protein Csl4 [Candidatus ainarchaeum sp.]|nr:exosome complex RNA-binding protein Csl4 [Candidatus ainarchaeum sp.]
MSGNGYVLPGALLGAEEEFVAGQGTFMDGDGGIRAALCGIAQVSPGKVVSVRPSAPAPHALAKGDVVVARVEAIYEPVALLQVEPSGDARGRQSPTQGYSVIHASRIRNGYVELVHDELRIGDIVRAAVEEIRADGEVSLSTKGPGLGVVKAYCSRCRNPLSLKGGKLKCGSCGSVENRYLSRDYAVSR